MIFSTDQLYDASSVFHGRGGDPLDWTSRLPDLSVFGFKADPALMGDLFGGEQVAQLAMRNVASALRLTAGRVAITQGFSSMQLPLLANLFGDPLEILTKGLDIAKEVLGSKAFSQAIDQIGWIPIVGWIIEILASVVELVIKIVANVRDKNLVEARRALAKIGTIPLAQWSQGADEVLARTMMMRLDDYDAQWIVSPRYPARSGSDFKAKPQEVNPGDDRWAGWLVYTGSLGAGAEGSSGLGFVPGTRNLHGAMELHTRGGRDLRDLGSFYPTARLAAVQWWEMIVAGGPAMFSIDARAARAAWADYLRSAVEFGDHVLDGWSMSINAAEFGATHETCVTELYGVGECRKAKRGQLVPIPGTGHRSAYLEYLFRLFEPRRRDTGKGWDRDNIDWEDTIPGRALENLQQRQRTVLQSLACMTVDDSVIDGQPRFRAIGTPTSKGPLWQRWYESVVTVFQSGDWRRVRFDDVPEGALKQELRERCASAGVECSQLGKQHATTLAPGPSSLGDPVPPTPPNPIEVMTAVFTLPEPKSPKKRRRISASTLALAAGVLGGAWVLSKK